MEALNDSDSGVGMAVVAERGRAVGFVAGVGEECGLRYGMERRIGFSGSVLDKCAGLKR